MEVMIYRITVLKLQYLIQCNHSYTSSSCFHRIDNGSTADINNYVGEVITFGSGTSDSQNSIVKITNPNIALGTRYDFALLNVSGGNAATIGENSTFTLIVGDPGSVPLSVENERAGVTISPNPTTDFINVKIDKNKVLRDILLLICQSIS